MFAQLCTGLGPLRIRSVQKGVERIKARATCQVCTCQVCRHLSKSSCRKSRTGWQRMKKFSRAWSGPRGGLVRCEADLHTHTTRCRQVARALKFFKDLSLCRRASEIAENERVQKGLEVAKACAAGAKEEAPGTRKFASPCNAEFGGHREGGHGEDAARSGSCQGQVPAQNSYQLLLYSTIPTLATSPGLPPQAYGPPSCAGKDARVARGRWHGHVPRHLDCCRGFWYNTRKPSPF